MQTLTQKDVQSAQLCYLLFVVCVILFRKQRTKQAKHFNFPSAASWMKLLPSDCSIKKQYSLSRTLIGYGLYQAPLPLSHE